MSDFDMRKVFAEVVRHEVPIVKRRGEHVELSCIVDMDVDASPLRWDGCQYRLYGRRFFEGREREMWREATVMLPADNLQQAERHGLKGAVIDEVARHARMLYGMLIAERPKFRIRTRGRA